MYKCTSPPILVFFRSTGGGIPISKRHPATPSASPRPCSLHWQSTSLSAFAFTFASILTPSVLATRFQGFHSVSNILLFSAPLAPLFRCVPDPTVQWGQDTPTHTPCLDSPTFGTRKDSAPSRSDISHKYFPLWLRLFSGPLALRYWRVNLDVNSLSFSLCTSAIIFHLHFVCYNQTWIQDLLIQDQDRDSRLVKTGLETSRDQDSSLENSKSGYNCIRPITTAAHKDKFAVITV